MAYILLYYFFSLFNEQSFKCEDNILECKNKLVIYRILFSQIDGHIKEIIKMFFLLVFQKKKTFIKSWPGGRMAWWWGIDTDCISAVSIINTVCLEEVNKNVWCEKD